MMDRRYHLLSEYLQKENTSHFGSTAIFHVLSKVILELTLSYAGETIFKGSRHPILSTADVTEPPVLVSLYKETQKMEHYVGWWSSLISASILVVGTLSLMIFASHYVQQALLIGVYLMILSMLYMYRDRATERINDYIQKRSYSGLLYKILYG